MRENSFLHEKDLNRLTLILQPFMSKILLNVSESYRGVQEYKDLISKMAMMFRVERNAVRFLVLLLHDKGLLKINPMMGGTYSKRVMITSCGKKFLRKEEGEYD